MILAAHYRTGETFEFIERGGRLKMGAPKRGRTDLMFGPGFFDLQNNGYACIDFNSPETTPEQIADGIRATWKDGCTHLLPTLVTTTPERFEAMFRNFVRALKLDREIERSVPGFHMEGPFMSPVDGARGAHPLSAVTPVRQATWRKAQKAAEGRIKLMTLAPEVKGTVAFIGQLREERVLPAIGHTMADRAQVNAAIAAGALLSTHLGNGCPQQMHRHYNPVMAQLADDRLTATLITDGIHLPPEVVKAYARAKGPDRAVIITDSMSAAGAPPGRYSLAGLTLEVGADRVVRFPGSQMFAGSALTMDRAVSGYRKMAEVSWAEAWDAASTQAWRVLRAADPQVRPDKTYTIARINGDDLEIVGTTRGGLVST